jgi:integrase/recombinase XerD
MMSLEEVTMSLGRQSKVLSKKQVTAVSGYLRDRRNGLRNETVFLLSVKAGLRAKEIAELTWSMVLESDATVSDEIHLTNDASKGTNGGRVIPLHPQIKSNLMELHQLKGGRGGERVITSERSDAVGSQTIINMFQRWYRDLGLEGCSSHSGRRTFITQCARQISTVGGSLRDVQYLAGHSSLQTTQRYIEGDSKSRVKVVGLL